MNTNPGFRWMGLSSLIASLLVVAGCSLAPTYERPAVDTPVAFKESSTTSTAASATVPADSGTWKTAQPSEAISRGEWWTVFGDASLNDLEQQALAANQNLKASTARLKESRAIQQTAGAGLFPTVGAGFGPTREKLSPASQLQPDGGNGPSQTVWRAQAPAAY